MESSHAHLLELTEELLLFCRSIWIHIGTVNSDYRDTVAGNKLMAKWLTDVALITEQHRTKWQRARQIMHSYWTYCKTDYDAGTLTNEMNLTVKLAFVSGIVCSVILDTRDLVHHFACTRRHTGIGMLSIRYKSMCLAYLKEIRGDRSSSRLIHGDND